MKSLIRKELLELGMIVSLPFLMLCGIFIAANRFENTLLAPNIGPIGAVFSMGVFAGVLVAFFQFEAERRRGTLAYLLHRGSAHEGVFLAKVVAGLAGTSLLTIGPPIVYALWQALSSPNAPVLQWSRVFEMCEAGSFGLAVYALSVLATQLGRGLFVNLVLALFGAGGILVLGLLSWVAVPAASSVPASMMPLHLVLAAGLLTFASRLFLRPRDREVSFAPAPHAALLAILALVVLPAAALLVCAGQASVRSKLLGERLAIVQDLTTREFRTIPFESVFERDAQNHSKFAPIHQPNWREIEDAEDALRLERRGYERGAPGFEWEPLTWGMNVHGTERGAFDARVYFDRGEGVVRVFALAFDGRASDMLDAAKSPAAIPSALTLAKPGSAGRFSRSTRVIGVGRSDLALVDPEDGSLWRLDIKNFASPITKAGLPDDDRFAGFVTMFDRERLRFGKYQYSEPLLRGANGYYAFEGDRFVRHPRSEDRVSATVEEAPALVELRSVVTDSDLLASTVDVRDAKSGEVLFSHRYEPQTLREKSLAAAAQIGTLLASPYANVRSFLRPAEPRRLAAGEMSLFHDPLFAGGARVGLLAVGLALSAVLTLLVVRRLRARGAGRLLIAGAALLVALFGVPAFLLVRALEPRRRALADRSSETQVSAALIIQSA